ncbi:hypothetical protein CBL_14505 [Carabus blaptoides fortunei]
MTQRDTVIHLVAGGVAGTVGAIVTCPLEKCQRSQQKVIIHRLRAEHIQVDELGAMLESYHRTRQ